MSNSYRLLQIAQDARLEGRMGEYAMILDEIGIDSERLDRSWYRPNDDKEAYKVYWQHIQLRSRCVQEWNARDEYYWGCSPRNMNAASVTDAARRRIVRAAEWPR